MNDALRKAAEERERKRRRRDRDPDPVAETTPVSPLEPALSEPALSEPALSEPALSEPAVAGEGDAASPPSAVSGAAAEPATPSSDSGSLAARARDKAQRERASDEAEAPSIEPFTSYTVDERVISYHGPQDPRSEQMRGIRTTLLTMDSQPKTIAITSGSREEGKSLACANLAASLVEGGLRRVLLVDANLRHPQLCEIVAARDDAGLSDLMAGGASDPRALIQQTGMANVDLLPAGRSLENPGSLLNPKALAGVLGLVEDDYDFVIVDTPALDEYADAAVMAPEVDGAILVCQVEGPPRSASQKALDLLDSARARVLGLVATNCR
ncbi:MAG: CpsD/CapB family tyrosine-protein kinase [Planctomycetes bacterium]|nr:CpsD/CapB family tyrosine-protein kinase [Planctomycetota bacterium]